MQKLFSIEASKGQFVPSDSPQISRGLAPIICYDPWFPRCLETIKQSINDGIPLLVRLHSAASYPIKSMERYNIDLESHAVLVVGYDDDQEAIEIVDPWNKGWGGMLWGRRWFSYQMLQIVCVNGTANKVTLLSPMNIKAHTKWDESNSNHLSLNLEVGFYVPKGTIMDLESWAMTEISVECHLPRNWNGSQVDFTMSGHWIVGEKALLSIPLQNNIHDCGEIKLSIKCTVEGKRPYQFRDVIEVVKNVQISKPNESNLSESFLINVI